MSKAALEQSAQEREKTIDVWEEIDKELPTTLEGTSFKIPYEQIPVRQLVTRAEFAREVGKETPTQSFVGRKINRKSFQNPLSQEGYVAIKSNRGNSPQLLFSYPEGAGVDKPEISLDNLPKPENIVLSQKSKYGELMDDKRSVKLSRIVKGTNIKGQEDQTFYYLDNSSNKPKTKYILQEQAWKNPDLDFVTRGSLFKRNDDSSNGVLFCKVQSSKLNNDTLFFAVEYSDGKPVNTITKSIPLKDLPIFEETLRERPEMLFGKSDTSETDFSGDFTIRGVTMNFPKSFDLEDVESFKSQSPITMTRTELPEDSDNDNKDDLEVHIDPEVDSDLDATLKNLKKNLGKRLLEVYFYGSIPRGYKRLQSDIDLLAVVSDKESAATPMGGFESEPFLIHDALGTHTAKSAQYQFRNIEVHTIKESKFKKPDNLRLSEFLRNALDGAVKIY
ncbi:MAG: nucleotidyltransferase domain-containing protein [bacterium]|nr:nucleotidyltransferase domain-containing protein [bacterium]